MISYIVMDEWSDQWNNFGGPPIEQLRSSLAIGPTYEKVDPTMPPSGKQLTIFKEWAPQPFAERKLEGGDFEDNNLKKKKLRDINIY